MFDADVQNRKLNALSGLLPGQIVDLIQRRRVVATFARLTPDEAAPFGFDVDDVPLNEVREYPGTAIVPFEVDAGIECDAGLMRRLTGFLAERGRSERYEGVVCSYELPDTRWRYN